MEKKTLENVIVHFYMKKRDGPGLGMTIAEKVIEGYQGKSISAASSSRELR
jgi:nitrogen-specific signal transduction histidine kinase